MVLHDSLSIVQAPLLPISRRDLDAVLAKITHVFCGSHWDPAKEVRDWYFRGRHVWPSEILQKRLSLINEIISGLVVTSNQQRRRRNPLPATCYLPPSPTITTASYDTER